MNSTRRRSFFFSTLLLAAGTVTAFADAPLPDPHDGMTAPNPDNVIPAAPKTRPLSIAVYQGGGSGDDGIINVTKRASLLPGAKVTLLSAADFGKKDLTPFDIVVFSGGSGSKQAAAIGEAGRENVRKYVHQGGSYLGICAGAYLATAGFPWSLGIVNAKTVSPKWNRGLAFLDLELTDDGRKVFGEVNDKFIVRYHNGPIIKPAGVPDLPDYTVDAYFRSEVAENGSPVGAQVNSPAVIQTTYGKGRVVTISPHPEGTKGLENFIPRALVWLGEK